ncbi:MAG TPA: hypothetical protein VGD69_20615 [Herpetosiphonaceae bacterium]
MRRVFWIGMSALLALAIASGGLYARADTFPALIDLPNGWLPEGIVTGRGPVIYSGSRANGAIYAADLRTGEGSILVPGVAGRIAVGLSFDQRSNYIFAAGGANGNAFVYDADTGATVASYQFASAPTFINDVIVTRDAAYFTDSQRAVLYKVPLEERNGQLSDTFETIPLSGDWQQVAGFNANGIEATRNGKELIIVNSTLGTLYRVNPRTGVATLIDLGGASVSNGDGILLQGKTLYVVRNRLNQVAVIRLNSDLERGEVVEVITNPNFDVPTTIAAFGDRLYAVNARFTTPPTPDTTYNIVQFRD